MKYKHLKTLGITVAISFAAAGAAFHGSQVTTRLRLPGIREAGMPKAGPEAAAQQQDSPQKQDAVPQIQETRELPCLPWECWLL